MLIAKCKLSVVDGFLEIVGDLTVELLSYFFIVTLVSRVACLAPSAVVRLDTPTSSYSSQRLA